MQSDDSPLHFVFENDDSNMGEIPSNALLEKQDYKIYRSKTEGSIEAVMAYCKIRESVLGDQECSLDALQISGIIERSVRTVLNSVVFDPLQPMKLSHRFRCRDSQKETPLQAHITTYFKTNSLGRSFETLEWYSPVSIKGLSQELDDLVYIGGKEPPELAELVRQCCMVVSSLIELVMPKDFYEFRHDSKKMDRSREIDFNRIETFGKDMLLFKGDELIQ